MSDTPAIKTDPMAEFQDKLRARVREDIRDLLPEGAVSALVQKAVEDEFFKPRIIVVQGYGSRDREAPSWFVEEVVKAAEPIIKAAVEKCIADHPAAVQKAIDDFLGPNMLAVVATQHMTSMLSHAIHQIEQTTQRLTMR